MITLSLGYGVAMSDAEDWTVAKKAISIAWMAFIDILILTLAMH